MNQLVAIFIFRNNSITLQDKPFIMRKIMMLMLTLAMTPIAFGQLSSIKKEIEKIIANKELTLGFALYNFSNGESISIHGEKRFPMQSVFKFPIALAILNEVDNKKLTLHQQIKISEAELLPETWSPIKVKYPNGAELPLSEIIKYTVSQSDNNGCDLLLKMLGGVSVANQYIISKGVSNINIQNNEEEMHRAWDVQFNNWTTPNAMIELLQLFNNEKLLLPDTHTFLWNCMAETSTGSIKNKLPKNAIVAHKTGTSGYNKENISAATNDVGIMILPDGQRIAFVIFITDSKEKTEVNAEVITNIGALLYNLPKESKKRR